VWLGDGESVNLGPGNGVAYGRYGRRGSRRMRSLGSQLGLLCALTRHYFYEPRCGDAIVVNDRTLTLGGFSRLIIYLESRPLVKVVSYATPGSTWGSLGCTPIDE